MSQAEVVRSARASSRLDAAADWLLARLGEGQALVLAPSRHAADDLVRHTLATSGAGGLLGVHRTTVLHLATALATPGLAAAGLTPVSGLGVEALAARSIARCAERGTLTAFAPIAHLPGFARALAGTLVELRTGAVDRARLDAAGDAGRDLGVLLATYEAALASPRLVDAGDLVARGRGALDGGAPPPVGLPLLLLDLSPRARRERDLLHALAGRAPAVLATVPSGDDEGAEALEAALGAPSIRDLDDGRPPGRRRLDRLRRDVFRADLAPRPEDAGAPAPEPAPSDDRDTATAAGVEDDRSLTALTAPGEGRECVELARHLHALARDGLRFDRMAILLRDPRAYLPLVEEALRRAAVPAYFTRGTVRPHAAGRAFLALLACAEEGLSASRFAEYLSLAQVPTLDDDGAPPEVETPWVEVHDEQMAFKSVDDPGAPPPEALEDEALEDGADDDRRPVLAGSLRAPRQWERLLVDAYVVRGRARWARRLDGLDRELRLRLDELGGEDEAERLHLEARLRRLGHLRRFALPVIDALDALPAEATWGAWLDALGQLASRVLRRPTEVLRMLGELRPMAEVGPVTLEEVRRTLEARLATLRAEPPDRRDGRVFVATLDEVRGRSFDTVLVPGLAEGIFPRRTGEDPLLLDDARRLIDEALVTQARRVAQERLRLRLAIGAAEQRLIVSYPNLDTLQGRARVPSFYALDVLRAADGALPDLGRLEARAAASTAAILGWPAPRDPARAIDAAEYDLSVLEPLLRQRGDVTGKGRYLIHANETLARALRTRARRWRNRLSGADGIVDPDRMTRDVLAGHRLRKRSYSPTALQRYAECPYRFLLYAIHRLRPRDQAAPLEQLDPLTRGGLFHRVQFELHRELAADDLLPMTAANRTAVLARADAVLERIAAHWEDELAPAIPRVWHSEIESLRTDLRGWIRAVVEAGGDWRPAHFELSFGLGLGADHDAASRAEPAVVLDGVQLRGSIDLVERDDRRGVLRVTDHKTGKPYRRQQVAVGGGEVLQPLLYALAAEARLEQPVTSGRLFYCTRRGGFEEREVPFNQANRATVGRVLATVDHAIDTGLLPAAPREGACRWCDYQSVCGPHEERRLAVKLTSPTSAQRLEPLRALRALP